MQLTELLAYLNQLLQPEAISDNSWNGLQVEGKSEVNKILLAVDACLPVFHESVLRQADIIISHHGLLWKNVSPNLHSWQLNRIRPLIANNISLYAAHLPLDRHPEVGNNSQLASLLNGEITGDFMFSEGVNIGYLVSLPKPLPLDTIAKTLNKKLSTNCHVINSRQKPVQTIAICSGGGGYSGFYEALNSSVDLYLTGDAVDIHSAALDAGLDVIFAGHYATETLGLKALGKHLQSKFPNLTIEFFDHPTNL